MNVLVVDDHALFREGLALLLRPLSSGGRIYEAADCEQAKDVLAAASDIHLVLMDIGLPGMSGLDAIRWLQTAHPGIPVVALSSADDRDTVVGTIEAGALGFIPKSASSGVMMGALQVVLANGIYLPPGVFLPNVKPRTTASSATPDRVGVPPLIAPAAPHTQGHEAESSAHFDPSATLGLTARQTDVLDQLLLGKSAKLICRDLNLAPGTVKAHTTAVLRALNVTTRTQAVIAAAQLGYRLKR